MGFELDHIFVAASLDAPEIQLLEAAGFIQGPSNDHPGQGTACRRVYFESAYLELLWLTDVQAASTPPVLRTGLAQRADPQHPSSPFGFGLRSPVESGPAAPFETWRYSPSYLPEGVAFAIAENSNEFDEPLIFVLPFSRTPDWAIPDHPNGARALTRVRLSTMRSSPSKVMAEFVALGLISVAAGEHPLIEIELDHGIQSEQRDLRPGLPIKLSW